MAGGWSQGRGAGEEATRGGDRRRGRARGQVRQTLERGETNLWQGGEQPLTAEIGGVADKAGVGRRLFPGEDEAVLHGMEQEGDLGGQEEEQGHGEGRVARRWGRARCLGLGLGASAKTSGHGAAGRP